MGWERDFQKKRLYNVVIVIVVRIVHLEARLTGHWTVEWTDIIILTLNI